MLKLYNSLTRRREEFKAIHRRRVGIYVCGPTVYGPTHLGHARTWIFFDWLRRYFIYRGFKVKFVQNITDTGHLVGDAEEGEDKIEKEAKKRRLSPQDIARQYEKEYFEDLAALNILKPDESPRASEYIKEIIKYIEVLLKNGYAYEVSGNVYFEAAKFADYGRLSGRDFNHLREETRVQSDPKKKNQADFALWLLADKEHLQKWPSPWGEGYPGWHIECSVMSAKYLGQPFDIHGSASELIFPHHENELAQSWGYSHKLLANFWLHSGMLLISGRKMSKSLENYLTVPDVLKDYDADTIKLAFMATFWRKPFDWDQKALEEARKFKHKLIGAKEKAGLSAEARGAKAGEGETGLFEELTEAIDDDFNAPKALAAIRRNLGLMSRRDFTAIEKIFGLKLMENIKLSDEAKEIIVNREKAREKGDFKEADRLRRLLEEQGIEIQDTEKGPKVLTK